MLVVLGAGAFIAITTLQLPPVVATHFDASGAANGHMPRGAYLAVMLLIGAGAPLFIGLAPGALMRRHPDRINLPNREYWLAPGRRDATVAYVVAHATWFAVALALFLARVHWLVVEANGREPAMLSTTGIATALALFGLAVTAWLVALFLRFRLPA